MGFRLALVRLFNRKTLRRFWRELEDTQAAQETRLQQLLHADAQAGYLTKHGGRPGMSPDAYRAQLPAVDYDEMWPYIEPLVQHPGAAAALCATAQPVSMFLKTSGTTGRPKLLPVTPEYEAETDRGRRVWIERMLAEDERNALGAHLTIVSPAHEDTTPSGLPIGSNTGRIFLRQPDWLRAFSAAPYEACGLSDFDLRYWAILRWAVGKSDVGTLTTANPSTVLLVCQRILAWGDELADAIESGDFGRPLDAEVAMVRPWDRAETVRALRGGLTPDPVRAREVRAAIAQGSEGLLTALWPQLTTINCWRGGHAPIYLARLRPFLGSIPVRDPGFSASEGLFAIPLRSGTAEGVLHNSGPFMEFVPEGDATDRTLLSHQLEVGQRYELIATTGGGLWRYKMNDVIEVTGHMGDTPVIRFVYKAGGTLSATGEKVTTAHAVEAATALIENGGVVNACATLEWTDPPRYVVAVAFSGEPREIAEAWDEAMGAVNVEYKEKRQSRRLGPPRIEVVDPRAFDAWRRRRVEAGAPDGQVKLPPLVTDLDALERSLLGRET
jgi:hypothetical protein